MRPQGGTVQALFCAQRSNPLYEQPVVQITGLSKFSFGEIEKTRYKANLSDGTYYMKAVFSSELTNMLDSGTIGKYTVIKIGNFTVRQKDNNNYIYVQSIVEHENFDHEIGRAVNISSGKQSLEPSGMSKEASDSPKENTKQTFEAAKQKMPYNTEKVQPEKKMKLEDDECTEIRRIFPHKKTMKFTGRVVSKSDIKRFTTAKGDGCMFTFEVADKTGQIKCVVFSELVEKFFPLVETDKTYMISNVLVRPANKKFASNTSDFEIHLDKKSEIARVSDDGIPKYMFKFVKTSELTAAGMVVDYLGVVKEVYPTGKITTKATGREISRRNLVLVDPTGSCRLTIWGSKADEEYEKDTVMCIKSAKVGEYNGVTLSANEGSQIIMNIDIPEAIEMLAWYQEEGSKIAVDKPKRSVKRSLISEVKEQSLEYATVQGSLLYVKEDGLYYEACSSENCSKKVTVEDNGVYKCEKCNYTFEKCNYRYMINAHIADFTGQLWVTIFDESGKTLIGATAAELKEMAENNSMDAHNLIKGLTAKEFQFRIKNKEEYYNGESKLRSSCLEIIPIDFVSETRRMLDAIEKI